ncbi:MAG: acetyltransferase [Myxococcales bacterium]|nr:MAG: acetyltransferase [Myxococcales bacterium]
MTRVLFVLGAGGHGRVVADAAIEAGWSVRGFLDARPTRAELLGLPVHPLASEDVAEFIRARDASVVVAVGDNRKRQELQRALADGGVPIATVVHPSSVVARSARLGAGAMVLASSVVGVDASIGAGCIINTGVRVDHDGVIGEYAHLSPGVSLGGEVTVGEGTHLGVGVSVRNRVSIGSWSMVGVGAAVVKDLPASVKALGVPARVVGPWGGP